MNDRPLAGIVMGSTSDRELMEACVTTLKELAIPFEITVSSAHRSPEKTRNYAMRAHERGIEVIIAGAGWAAHLAGVLASHTTLPIIGVPIDSSPLRGIDALLSTVQMPPGVPVATMAVGSGGAVNAAVFAAEILALKHPHIARSLDAYRSKMQSKAEEINRE
jgi:phosphoribosylaminoimidazole carboxylase PurE protein